MDKLKINTGAVRLLVDCDGVENEISFNPTDLTFVENLYKLISELDAKKEEFAYKEAELDKNNVTDENGIPNNAAERIDLIKEVCIYLRGRLDDVFGPETSNRVFGSTNTLDMFEQFFEGITPYILKARTDKTAKYTNRGKKGVM